MTAAAAVAPVTARAGGLGWVLANIATVTGRNLHRLVRVPTLAAFATAQPVMFVLLFTYAFGGAIHPPGVEHYVDYLLPGLYVLTIAFGASQTGVAVAEDLATGMIDRFRALPMARSAVLAGRTAADTVRNLFVLALMTAVGTAVGFRFHAGPAAAAGTIGLALLVGLAFSWINALIGLLVRDPESAGLAGLLPVIALVFTSSTFVPVATMPGWLQAFASVNPVTVTVGALRALCLGGPTVAPVWQALAWIGGLLAVTVPAAVLRYQRTTAMTTDRHAPDDGPEPQPDVLVVDADPTGLTLAAQLHSFGARVRLVDRQLDRDGQDETSGSVPGRLRRREQHRAAAGRHPVQGPRLPADLPARGPGVDGPDAGAAHSYLADPGMLFFPLGTPATWRMLSLRPPVGSGGESPLRWRNSRPSPISTPAAGCMCQGVRVSVSVYSPAKSASTRTWSMIWEAPAGSPSSRAHSAVSTLRATAQACRRWVSWLRASASRVKRPSSTRRASG
jgi:ABC-2 type transport system permease protein/oleandomycin transport system permease protein